MRRFVRENGLSLVFLTFFVLAVVGQAIAGWVARRRSRSGAT